MKADLHQHIWTAPLLDALAARDATPFVRREHGVAVLHAAGERPYVIEDSSSRPVIGEWLDFAVIAISSPIGIEALPRDQARELITAHLEGVGTIPAWGPVALEAPDPDDVDELLACGCVGVSLPATALAGPEPLDGVGGVLERAAVRGAPVFIHPGASAVPAGGLSEPLWWRALTDYVAQMQAAWLTFAAFGRREHPELRIVFAMLAGGAPLTSERLTTRGGPAIDLADPLTFYDTSSYGPVAIEAMGARVGVDQLVYGSDRPVVEPQATPLDEQLAANSGRLVMLGSAV